MESLLHKWLTIILKPGHDFKEKNKNKGGKIIMFIYA